MIDLLLAGMNLRKAAHLKGYEAGEYKAYYKHIAGSRVWAIVGDDRGEEVKVTISDIESAAKLTWREIYKRRV